MKNFWNWFLDNHHTIKNLLNHSPQNQEIICFWIKQNLNYHCKKIDFIIVFPKKTTDPLEFIITAKGNSKLCKIVIDLVDHAPPQKHGKISAFIVSKETIQKRVNQLQYPIIIHDISLKKELSAFTPLHFGKMNKKQPIHLHLKNHTIYCTNKTFHQALFIIVETLYANTIVQENIQFVQLAQNKIQKPNLIHLHEFYFHLNNYYQNNTKTIIQEEII